RYAAKEINFDGSGEAGLAGLFLNSLENGTFKTLVLRGAPISYLFDSKENNDFFTMGIHLPGIMKWGDISLAAALDDGDLRFIDSVNMSCSRLSEVQLKTYEDELTKIKILTSQSGKIYLFANSE